jgi:hypothetical protein
VKKCCSREDRVHHCLFFIFEKGDGVLQFEMKLRTCLSINTVWSHWWLRTEKHTMCRELQNTLFELLICARFRTTTLDLTQETGMMIHCKMALLGSGDS